MKECKKCGGIMPDESDENICEECKQYTNKRVAALFVGSVATGVVLYTIFKDKFGKIPAKQISDVTNNVISGSVGKFEKIFGGVQESTLDSLAKSTNRGVKAIVEGDTLKYFYKSASGKSIFSAIFNFDDKGELIGHLGNGSNFSANSPRFFCETILEKMKKN